MEKVKVIADSKNISAVTKLCGTCNQLEFDHKPGPCTMLSKSSPKSVKNISDITEKVMEDVVNAISRIQSWNIKSKWIELKIPRLQKV